MTQTNHATLRDLITDWRNHAKVEASLCGVETDDAILDIMYNPIVKKMDKLERDILALPAMSFEDLISKLDLLEAMADTYGIKVGADLQSQETLILIQDIRTHMLKH